MRFFQLYYYFKAIKLLFIVDDYLMLQTEMKIFFGEKAFFLGILLYLINTS